MTLNAKPLSIIVVAILFGIVTLANVIGRWDSELNPQVATDNDSFFSTQPAPADINESHTFGDIDRLFNIPTTILATAFNLPDGINITAFSIKELETIYVDQDVEIGTSSVQLFVALYTGLIYETTEQIYLPLSAANTLISRRVLSPEDVEFIDSYALILDPMLAFTSVADNHGETSERTIKGKTTFQELFDWGVSPETIEQIIGEAISTPHQIVKDYCTEKELDFEEIKLVLEEEANKSGHDN